VNHFNGLTQIDPIRDANIVSNGTASLPEPITVTLPLTNPEALEGSLIRIVGLTKSAAELDTWAVPSTITAEDGSANTIDIRMAAGSTAGTPPTYPVTVVGVLGQSDNTAPRDSGYQIQPRTQGDLTSAPTDNPQEQYLAFYGLVKGTPEAAGTADPDGDGLNNAGEFAFGTSPVSGASRAVTQESVVGGIKIKWLQRSGINYTVKSTVNLGSAFSGSVSSTPVSPQPGGLGDYQQYEATLTGGDKGFIKVEAIVP
jgi:hypothetical protein